MDSNVREQKIAAAFVELADTLVDDFDVIDFLQRLATRCVELLGGSAAGLMLATPHGDLQTAASSDERAWLLELLEIQHQEGPCLDCYHSRTPVLPVALDSADAVARWPVFTPRAREYGFRSTYAIPLRLRETVIGALNLFVDTPLPELGPGDVQLAQALADAATIGILQQRTIRQGELVAGQLQTALTSRVRLEQAKGMLAERWAVSVDTSFDMLRGYARRNQRRLTDVALAVVLGELDPAEVRGDDPGHA
ncbi:GAF and ANTAR domain-containing protein [Streptomyces sp. NBC_00237]|uniref:GAF and ANTAR domain-containing protein n=1 Tax=Streptomyces sp. NBC_00237 TaxID=2975687 RepID=UPI00224EFA04|nr:GAF and ANTAR domain-containing protein [Streptomyces sp. NBC_00237]MCX5200986.1 GAF and ANTAR domain-containing protein [Streptomyces sp. NBC_00237]